MKDPAAVALGSRGGKKTFALYGKEHYKKRAEHMNKKIAEKKKTQAVKDEKLDMPFSLE